MADLSRFVRRQDAPKVKRDPIEEIIGDIDRERGRANLIDDAVSPMDALRAKQLSRELGYPAAAISANVKEFDEEAGLEAWNRAIDAMPGMRRFLANDPLNAAAAKEDREALASVSQTFATADQLGDPLGKKYISGLKTRLMSGTSRAFGLQPTRPSSMIGSVAGRLGGSQTVSQRIAEAPRGQPDAPKTATAGNIARGQVANFAYGVGATAVGVQQYLADALGVGDDLMASEYGRRQRRELEELRAEGNVQFEGLGTLNVGGLDININPGQWGYNAATSLTQLGAALATGNPLGAIGVMSGAEFYQRVRQRGAGGEEAAFGALATGAIEVATEKFGLDYLIGNFGKQAAGKFVGGLLLREIPGEMAATVGQEAIDALTTGGVGWEEYKRTLPENLVTTVGTTLAMGGALGAINTGARRLFPEVRAQEDIARSTAGAAWLDNLMANAGKSKVRQTDPETFKEFVETHTQDSPVRNLYVPVETVRELMQQEGYEPGFFERFQEQIAEAEATQGDVVIPIAEAAAELAGTPAWEAIKDQVRIYPGGLSQKEALERHGEIMATLEQRGAEIAQEAAEGQQTPESEVYVDVRNRLLAAGRPSAEAEQIARIYAAHYETRAARMGGTAMESLREARIVFPGEQPGRADQGRELSQGKLAYHGTRNNFAEFKSDSYSYFTSDRRIAEDYAIHSIEGEGDPRVITARLNFTNPLIIDAEGKDGTDLSFDGEWADIDRLAVKAEMLGHDGLVVQNVNDSAGEYDALSTVYAVLNPAQVEIVERQLFQGADDLAEHVPGLDNVLPYLEQEERDRLKKRSAARIVELVETFPDAEEMASVAFAGRAKRGWYERSAQALLDIFGMEDAPRFAALLAATSPQTSVESNTINALAIWVNWDKAGRPTDPKKIVAIMGKSVQGKKGADSVLPAWINNTVRALSADNPADVKLSGPKVNSFMANLVGMVDEVTNDAWMANYALLDQTVFKGTPQRQEDGSTIKAKSPGYVAFSVLVRRAADILTKRTGELWTPAEVQETVWSFTKILTEKRDSAGSLPVADILAAGNLTHAEIGGTPDFAMLFQRGIYRNILEAGGYAEAVEDLERSSYQAGGSPGPEGPVTDAEGAGIDPGRFIEHLNAAGDRIEVRVGRNRQAEATRQRDLFEGIELQPLTGLPATVKVDGVPVTFGPFGPAREAARRYMLRNGYPYSPPKDYARVDVERATRIAEAFEQMEHRPDDPEVKAAYRAMIDETIAQYREIERTGLTVEFIKGDDPYGNPRNAILDVVENNHLWVFPTDDGFGGPSSQGVDISGNPLLEVVPGITISGRPVRANDLFRIVHDYFGHIKEGVGFRADGEENAWRIHSSMYSPLARRAMTTETRGQNSWVNFGPFGEQNRTAGPGDTEYAPQKIGLLPDWVATEGASTERTLYQDVMFSTPEGVVEPVNETRVLAYHGTPFEFEQFDSEGAAVWFSEGRSLAELYANPKRFGMRGAGRVITAELSITKPLDLADALGRLPSHEVVPDSVAWAREEFGFDLKAHGWQRYGQDYAHAIFRSAAFANAARAAGYDAIKVTEKGHTTWGMLNPDTVKDAETGRTLYQDDVFYSAAARVVEQAKQEKATAAQWKALLTPGKTPGIKAEEIEWSGIHDWLDMQTGPIEKGVLLQVLQDRGIQVEEVVLGAVDPEGFVNVDEDGNVGSDVQFKSWSSDPSNDTYRELLITLPLGEGGNPSRAPSTHWDIEAVVAHTRFMEKTDAEGKRVLFIQSDWHQKGRDQGYDETVTVEERAAIEQRYNSAQSNATDARRALQALVPEENEVLHRLIKASATSANAGGMDGELRRLTAMVSDEAFEAAEKLIEARLSLQEASIALNNVERDTGIPEAPFKTSWPALVMKRVIRWAVDNGYDRVAWTTGKEQSERYNLSNTTGKINAFGEGKNVVFTVERREAFNAIASMEGVNSTGGYLTASRDKVREIFGAGVGDTLAALPDDPNPVVLDGRDLTVGGEGMRAFYDRNLVNITNDIIKKYGAKVGPVEFQGRTYETRKGMVQNPGFDITPKLREAASQGFSLFQGPRGSVTFTTSGDRIIRLFDTANASTLLHETAHIWLEELRTDAAKPNAPQDVKDDWQRVATWFRDNGHPVRAGQAIPTEAHELFARGGERYFMEGKAPSAALSGAFKQFRAWLLRIYQVVQNLRSPINDDIRGVFDRLLATQEAIDAYSAQAGTKPLFNSAEEAGMTEAEFAAYQRSVSEARDEAYDALLYKTMEAIRRKRKAEYAEGRATLRAEVAAEINAQPVFVALHLLRTGRWLGDPERDYQDVKLNTGWLIDTFGEDVLGRLPRGLPITRGDGMDGDLVAEMVGAESGRALVEGLVGMRVASEQLRAEGVKRSLRENMIEERTDELMAERYGDSLNDGTIEEEAVAALNTARQGEIIAQEARQLAKRSSVVQAQTPYQFAREWARRKVMAGWVREVASRSAVQRYTRATAKAQRAAEQAILAGDTDEAYRQKQAQLLNHALLAESKKAADEIDTVVERMRRLAGRAAMKSVDQGYLDKIHMLLENYDFRPRSQRSIDEQEGFQAWLEDQRAKGFEVHIPPRLENRGEPYSRVTVEELLQLNDLVQSLLHLGKTKQKLKVAQAERDFNEFRDEVSARIRQLPVRKLPEKPINEEARRGASLASELVKVETIVEELDGGKVGPLHDALIVGATEAANQRNRLRQQVLLPIAQAYNGLTRKQWARLQEKITIPGLTWNTLNEGDPRAGQPVTLTRSELMAVFLNMGNLSNLEKLTKGERWPAATLKRAIDEVFTKEDFDFAQMLWDQVNSLWPQIVAVERELSGVVPEQVVATPIETRFGTYRGGYWPVVYDAARWQRAEDLEGQKLDDMFGLKSGVATQKGHTIARTQAFGPINLSLESVLFQHLEQVVTRLSYSAYARDVLRIVRDKTIRGLIDTHLGPEYRKQIEPWLARQIHEGAVHAKAARWWQQVLRQFRINMTVAAMGFRFSTGIAQTLGLTASAQRIGAKWVGTGMKRVALNPRAAAEFAFSRSKELADRTGTMNREVTEVFDKLRGKHSWLTEAQAWAFWHIGMIDRYVVALPTWLGAHERGMAEGLTDAEAVAYADKAVRMSQGSGVEKDLAAVQSPNNEAMRFFVMFYTPFNVMFNAQWQGIRGLKKGEIAPLAGVTFWWLIVSMLGDAMLSGDWPSGDEDEDGAVVDDWGAWFARNVFFGMFAGVPLLRDLSNYTERKMIGEYASLNTTPVGRVFETVDKAFKMGDKYVTEGEAPQRPIKQVADVTAVLTGTPVSQAGTTGQFLWDYGNGEADPQTVSDWYFGITRGKVPEDGDQE